MKCFYHNDLDGECSAAIVYHFFKNKFKDIFFIEMNYNIPLDIGTINTDEKVFVVDFSFQKIEEFDRLLKITKDVTWIDHHKTAIEKHSDKEYLPGIRGVGGKGNPAACKLTWDYLSNKERPCPRFIELISDYDSWTYAYNDTKLFKLGLDLEDTHPASQYWEGRFMLPDETRETVKNGEISLRYRDKFWWGLIRGNSFETEFEGYSGIACNAGPGVNSDLFQYAPKKDLMLPYFFDGKQFTVSIYTTKDHIDCSEIAKKYGGGGHKQAAGFQCSELPFKK